MKIALIHYTYPPTLGGVESVLQCHSELFADHGHEVRVLCATGESRHPKLRLIQIPELAATHPMTAASQEEISHGEAGTQFGPLVEQIKKQLCEHLEGTDLVFVHNLLTMPFNLAATEALRQVAAEWKSTRFVAWIHDLAAINPDYYYPDREPWRLLARKLPGFEYIAVSNLRSRQFAALTGAPITACRVIPNGISALECLNLTPAVAEFVASKKILSREIVLLCPARLLKRKNLGLALEIVAALKGTTPSGCACLITGPCDPHNPESRAYARELQSLVDHWGLGDEVFFVSELFTVTNPDLVSLYVASDAVLYPSLQEGFGIPLLEAAVHRLPIFCGDLEPLKDLELSNVTILDRAAPPKELAEVVREVLKLTANSRKDVINRFSWEAIYANQIDPLLKD